MGAGDAPQRGRGPRGTRSAGHPGADSLLRGLCRSAPARLGGAGPADRPLTFAEKVLIAHRRSDGDPEPERGRSYVDVDPDRVALQDALAQIVALQFMTRGSGRGGGSHDRPLRSPHPSAGSTPRSTSRTPSDANAEVYDFLRAVCAKYGIGFWQPGSGIIHQVVLENYAFPGGMMIGTDSHTPNAGGLGMIAVGVGGGDAIDVDDRLPVQRAMAEADRGAPDRFAVGLAVAEGRHPARRGSAHGERRHRRDRRVLRPGRRHHQRDRQSHDLQHGRRDRRHHVDVPL